MGTVQPSIFLIILSIALQSSVHAAISHEGPRSAFACEGSMLTIECPPGNVIHVIRALFGRQQRNICADGRDSSGWNTECMSTKAIKVVSEACHGFNQCVVLAATSTFGEPCLRTPKYLEVIHKCSVPNLTESPRTRPVVVTTVSNRPTTESSTASVEPTSTTTATPSTTAEVKLTTTPAKLYTAQSQKGGLCPAQKERDIYWPSTGRGEMAVAPCPNNPNVIKATWTCRTNGSWIDKPNLSHCVSTETEAITKKLKKAKESSIPDKKIVTEVVDDINKRPSSDKMYGGDVNNLAKAMREVVDLVDIQVHKVPDSHLVSQVNEVIVNTTSKLLNTDKQESWLDMPQSDQAVAATDMISAVEKSAFQLADSLETSQVVIKMDINIVMEVSLVDTKKEMKTAVFPNKDNSIGKWKGNSVSLPGKAIKNLGVDGLAKLVFIMYDNLEKLLEPKTNADDDEDNYAELKGREVVYLDSTPHKEMATKGYSDVTTSAQTSLKNYATISDNSIQRIVNSKIISASVNDENTTHLSENITYVLEHKTTTNVFNPTCSFWDYSTRTMSGRWSHVGCHVVETNTSHTTCQCNHLTNFAVLMDLHATPLDYHNSFALTLLTYACGIISLVCLLASFVTFLLCRSLQGDRNTIHKNLSLCLFIATLIFLLGIMQTGYPVVCATIAGFLHYFFLASFMWMLLEGVQLYFMLVKVFESERRRNLYFYLLGYGIPAVIVIVTLCINTSAYGTPKYCWLTVSDGFIWAFVGPVIVILAINLVMFVIAIYTMCRHKANTAAWRIKQQTRIESFKSWAKGTIVLEVLLGLTWSFGLLYINKESIIMAYLFTICNSLQGVFIFVFHCLGNEKVQKEYRQWIRKSSCLPTCMKVKYGGTPVSTLGSPNQSTDQSNNPLLRRVSNLFSTKKRSTSTTSSLHKSTLSDQKYIYQNAVIPDIYKVPKRESSRPLMEDAPETTLPSDNMNNYLEPANADEHPYAEIDETYREMSYIDGSIVDTNNMYDWGTGRIPQQRTSVHTEPLINIDKYIIKKTSSPNENSNVKRHSGESAFCEGEATAGQNGDPDTAEDNSEDEKLKGTCIDSDKLSNDSNYDSLKRQKRDARNVLNDLNRHSSTTNDSAAISSPNIVGSVIAEKH